MAASDWLEENWGTIQAMILSRWQQLSHEDLAALDGNVSRLISLIQEKSGEARETIEAYLESLADRGLNLRDQASQAIEDMVGGVRRHPRQGLAAAFGIGVIAGVGLSLLLAPRKPADESSGQGLSAHARRVLENLLRGATS